VDVYVLQHLRPIDDDHEDAKLIGVFSSEEAGKAAIAELLTRPGFAEHPDGFHIDRYEVDHICWADGFTTISAPAREPRG
jgi:hypothetical protein